MKERSNYHGLDLTEEEALGLLDIVMTSPADLSAEQRAALVKLSDFCREFIREESPTHSTGRTGVNAARPQPICAA